MNLWILIGGSVIGFTVAIWLTAAFGKHRHWRARLAASAPWSVGGPCIGGLLGGIAALLAWLFPAAGRGLLFFAACMIGMGVVFGLCLGVATWETRWGRLGVLLTGSLILATASISFFSE